MLKQSIDILLIEDNPGHVELIRRCLVRGGLVHEFNSADCLAKALESLERRTFDVVLADLSLPDSSGLSTINRICQLAPKLPVIVFTSLNDEDTAAAALDCGAQDYIVKDAAAISWPRLRQAIHYAVQRQLVLNEKQELLSKLQQATQLLERKNRHLSRLYRTAHEFVDHVSHEFRTPLSIIKEYASLVRDGIVGTVGPEQVRLLNVIDDRSDDLNTMVDDMLDVSKLKSGLLAAWRKPCSVEEIVHHVWPALERKALTRAVVLEKQLAEDLPTVYCDPEKAGRVIVNLVVNAIKFTRQSGLVRLSATALSERPEVTIAVSDDGPGIQQEHLKKIFRRFAQLNNHVRSSTKGFGLGLSIAKELTTLNLGEMSVESQLGTGSTFRFTIPCAVPREVVARYLNRMSVRQKAQCSASILVASIDPGFDDPLVRDMDRFLNYLLRRHDLLFRLGSGRWLFVVGVGSLELQSFIGRARQVREETNRNRPRAPLPEIRFHVDGTWPVDSQDEILARVDEFCHGAAASSDLLFPASTREKAVYV